jgi:UDPglucose 6-dehydrogenase
LSGRRFAVWGLAFRPHNDDVREAPSRVLIEQVLDHGAQIEACDPVATRAAQQALGKCAGLGGAERAMAAPASADALLIVTEWTEFRSPDFDRMKALMREPVLFAGRNLDEPALIRSPGFEYRAIGRRGTNCLAAGATVTGVSACA